MSYTGRPNVNFGKLLIAIAFGLLLAVLVVGFAVAASMGECSPSPDGSGCENDWLVRLLMFPGSLIVAFIAMYTLIKWTTKTDIDVR